MRTARGPRAGRSTRARCFSGSPARRRRRRQGLFQQAGSLWGAAAEQVAFGYNRTMKFNRSIPQATVIPVLVYPDVRSAVSWLSDAFGFEERLQIGEDHRSQLRIGDAAIIIGDVRGDRRPPHHGEVTHQVMVRVENASEHCNRAREHGARILMEPTDFEYGERQYTAEDLAGHQWTFTETLHDVDPVEWGGLVKHSTQ
jgi:uncharacterized glyoxalase superfamily protein PhnB